MSSDPQQVQALFLRMLELSPEERAAVLEHECAGDPELLARVDALLKAHSEKDSFLDQSDKVDLADFIDSERATADYRRDGEVGAIIGGRYTLTEKIGEGGMGEVWVAKQSEPVKRRVALKLIKAGMDSRAVLQRFEQERQALGMMDHPNIARVLDGGMTPLGQPFFVMELVNGLALNKFCDEVKLTPKARLELFVPICQAVQHAHQKGIVHRDLKPANILVTMIDGKPVPKVIDFGVAKATAGKLTEDTMSTGFGAVVGTLEYMSPEQAGFSNEDIDTRSDIYSLGVILYELLTGLRPIDGKRLRKAALTEMARIIREEEPSRPSTRLSTDKSLPSAAALRQTDPKRLMAMLRGELDWVVMKALEKDRNRRYETANGFARDIQRYLSDEVVEARPPSSGYRFRKYLRRNKGPVLAASLVLLALLAGTAVSTYFAVIAGMEAKAARIAERKSEDEAKAARKAEAKAEEKGKEALASLKIAEDNRDRADRHFILARKAVEDYLVNITEDESLKQADFHDLRKRLLELSVPLYEEMLREPASDFRVQMERARALGRLGDIRLETGETEQALAKFDEAIVLWDQLIAQFPTDSGIRQGLVSTLERLGRARHLLGQHKEAEQAMRRRISENKSFADEQPENSALRHALSTGHTDLAKLMMETGRLKAAKEELLAALKVDQELSVLFSDKVEPQLGASTTLHNLGMLDWQINNRVDAERWNRESLASLRKLADRFPRDPEVRVKLAGALDHLGAHYAQTKRLADAESHFREGLSQYQELVDDFPRVPQYQQEMAGCMGNLARLLLELKRDEEAEQSLDNALKIYEMLVEEHPSRTDFRQEFAFFLAQRSMQLLERKKGDDAEATCNRAVRIQEAISRKSPDLLDNYAHLGQSLLCLAQIYESSGKIDSARNTYRKALAYLKTALDKKPDHPYFQKLMAANRENLARYVNNIAWPLATHPEEAKRRGKDAVTYATEACELTDWKNWQYLDTLASAYAEVGEFENAIKWEEAAIKAIPLLNFLSTPELKGRLELYKSGKPFRDQSLGTASPLPPM